MNKKPLLLTSLSAAVLLGLSACGGGGSGGTTAQNTSTTSGPVTAFGSVYVNGVEYNTDNAKVYVEGSPAAESDLRVGMMVTVTKANNSTASAVHFSDDLEGLVISNSITAPATTGNMVIMGQTVSVDQNTIFESKVAGIATFSDIKQGFVVEVSGYYSTSTGTIAATRIEVKADTFTPNSGVTLEIKGTVSALGSTTFKLGQLVVNYNNADLTDLPNGLSDGLYVEVKSIGGLNTNDELIASKVELQDGGKDHHEGDVNEDYELKGKVMSVGTDTFTVNNQKVLLTNATEFEHGTLADLKLYAMVEVEGHFNANKELVADKVDFEGMHANSMTEQKGTVSNIATSATNIGSFTLTDANSVATTIVVNNMTIMKDSSSTPVIHFNLSSLVAGDNVEVDVYSNKDNPETFTATKLERK